MLAYDKLSTEDLQRRAAADPPDSPESIMARHELDRRAAKERTQKRIDHPRARDVADPLSEVTRRERTILLTLSSVLYAVALGDLVPNKIQALGIELTLTHRTFILCVLVGAELFVLTAFFIYSRVDIEAWEADFLAYTRAKGKAIEAELEELQPGRSDSAWSMLVHEYPATNSYEARRWFDRWAPIFVAVGALLLTIARALHLLP